MSNIRRVISRPNSDVYTRWTGSNLSELDVYWGVSFTVNGSGELNMGALGMGVIDVPAGDWFNGQGFPAPNSAIEENKQEVPEGPLAFVIDTEE